MHRFALNIHTSKTAIPSACGMQLPYPGLGGDPSILRPNAICGRAFAFLAAGEPPAAAAVSLGPAARAVSVDAGSGLER